MCVVGMSDDGRCSAMSLLTMLLLLVFVLWIVPLTLTVFNVADDPLIEDAPPKEESDVLWPFRVAGSAKDMTHYNL